MDSAPVKVGRPMKWLFFSILCAVTFQKLFN